MSPSAMITFVNKHNIYKVYTGSKYMIEKNNNLAKVNNNTVHDY